MTILLLASGGYELLIILFALGVPVLLFLIVRFLVRIIFFREDKDKNKR